MTDSRPENPPLSHLDAAGRAAIVDVTNKTKTVRQAAASARICLKPEVLAAILDRRLPKGDVLATARIAGIQAAKRTAELIPLCHPLPLEWVSVEMAAEAPGMLLILATARTTAKTGVEMEALTAATLAALTVYDMAKSADKAMEIGPIRLESKTGGKSGDFVRKSE